jgi:hypothetical protein
MIALRRDGLLEGIQVFGPSVESVPTDTGEAPTGQGFWFTRGVTGIQIVERHAKVAPPDRVQEAE